jgi:5-deoxy-glucuronate isomerase
VTREANTLRYHFRAEELREGIIPERGPLDLLSCQRLELGDGAPSAAVQTGPEEVVLVCISGELNYETDVTAGAAGFRDMLYLPWESEVKLSGDRAVVMRIGAPSDRDTRFAHIRFADIDGDPDKHRCFGTEETNSLRDVYMYIDDTFRASRLLVGIGFGRPGGWTVWPPHEHGDEKEELYVYFDLDGGFGIQCVYEDMEDARCFLVREGDMVAVPRGYHPNVGCPGGRIAYVYAMAARAAGERSFMSLRFQEQFGTRL